MSHASFPALYFVYLTSRIENYKYYKCVVECMAQLNSERIWQVFDLLDVPSIYARYSVGIDFFLAFLFFLGATKVTLAKRFPGSGGSFLIVSVSIALSVGFSLAEREMNFSLRGFGPLAAFIIIFVVSMVFYSLLRSLDMRPLNALSVSFITVFMSLQMVSPSIFDWIDEHAPLLSSLLYIGFLLCLVKLIISIFWKHKSLQGLASDLERYSGSAAMAKRDEQEQASDIKDAKSERRLTKRGKGDTKDIGSNLRSILKAIDKPGNSRESRGKIATALQRISKSEHSLFQRLQNLEQLNTKLGRHDSQRYQALRDRYATASGSEKETLRVEIIYEQQKLKAEQGIAALKNRVSQVTNAMNENIRLAVGIIRDGPDIRQAKAYVGRALECEEAITKELGNIIRLEKAVSELSKREKKTIRKNG